MFPSSKENKFLLSQFKTADEYAMISVLQQTEQWMRICIFRGGPKNPREEMGVAGREGNGAPHICLCSYPPLVKCPQQMISQGNLAHQQKKGMLWGLTNQQLRQC